MVGCRLRSVITDSVPPPDTEPRSGIVLPAERLSRRERSSVVKVLDGPQIQYLGPVRRVGIGGGVAAQ